MFLARLVPFLVLIGSALSLDVFSNTRNSRLIQGQLKSALKSLGKRCIAPGKNHLLLDSVTIDGIALSSLIVDSSVFEINVTNVVVKNLNRYTVSQIEKVGSKHRFESDATVYEARFRFPMVAVAANYAIHGVVAKMFPANGNGRFHAYYKQIVAVVRIKMSEQADNTTALNLADSDSLTAEGLTFEDVDMSVTESILGVETHGDRSHETFTVGTVLFWELAQAIGRQFQSVVPGCLDGALREADDGISLYHQRQ